MPYVAQFGLVENHELPQEASNPAHEGFDRLEDMEDILHHEPMSPFCRVWRAA